MRQPGRRATLLAAARLLTHAARADSFPARPLKLVVPYPAGDGPDVLGRSLAEALRPRLGQPVVVENLPGGGTSVAALALKRAPADGYTIMLGGASTLCIATLLNPAVGYDGEQDFTLLCRLVESPLVLLVNAQGPANLAELFALARRGGQWSFGSAGMGSPHHLCGALLAQQAGVEAVHVPYRGAGPALADLAGGRVTSVFSTLGPAVGLLQDGRLRALAVASSRRIATLPATPMLAELGHQGFATPSWIGLMAPARLPLPIAERLSAEAMAVADTPEGRARIEQLSFLPAALPFRQIPAGYVAAETARWRPIVNQSGATAG